MMVGIRVYVCVYAYTNPNNRSCISHANKHSGTVLEAKDYAVSGSGAAYVIGFLDLNYPTHGEKKGAPDGGSVVSDGSTKGDEEGGGKLARGRRHTALSRTEAEEMVQRALALAVGRDSHSGAYGRGAVGDRSRYTRLV